MSTRISSAAALLLLAACSVKGSDPVADADPEDLIECAIGGAAEFARACAVAPDGESGLIVHHPDGGFRRFERSGGTIATADGAERAAVEPREGGFEVTVEADRYRLPAEALGDARR